VLLQAGQREDLGLIFFAPGAIVYSAFILVDETAIARKFRLLSIRFTLEAFVWIGRSVIRIFRQLLNFRRARIPDQIYWRRSGKKPEAVRGGR
jgi:hypothetical protein